MIRLFVFNVFDKLTCKMYDRLDTAAVAKPEPDHEPS